MQVVIVEIFLSTLSLRRATDYVKYYIRARAISIHALLAESDGPPGLLHSWRCYFYPRSPCGERRIIDIINNVIDHFYPRSPCGERPRGGHINKAMSEHFYPRSPCGERLTIMLYDASALIFLSTLSLRRATASNHRGRQKQRDFYPRSPCGERLQQNQHQQKCRDISIHALLAESDWWLRCWQLAARDISIHALLAESDDNKPTQLAGYRRFLSTLSLRRATLRHSADCNCRSISIHALLAESDICQEQQP